MRCNWNLTTPDDSRPTVVNSYVRQKLIENPSFARSCGFTLPDPRRGYRQSHVPSLRKLEQFDQIMSNNGLWGEAAVGQVAKNLKEGFIKLESTLVHDTASAFGSSPQPRRKSTTS